MITIKESILQLPALTKDDFLNFFESEGFSGESNDIFEHPFDIYYSFVNNKLRFDADDIYPLSKSIIVFKSYSQKIISSTVYELSEEIFNYYQILFNEFQSAFINDDLKVLGSMLKHNKIIGENLSDKTIYDLFIFNDYIYINPRSIVDNFNLDLFVEFLAKEKDQNLEISILNELDNNTLLSLVNHKNISTIAVESLSNILTRSIIRNLLTIDEIINLLEILIDNGIHYDDFESILSKIKNRLNTDLSFNLEYLMSSDIKLSYWAKYIHTNTKFYDIMDQDFNNIIATSKLKKELVDSIEKLNTTLESISNIVDTTFFNRIIKEFDKISNNLIVNDHFDYTKKIVKVIN